MKKAKIIFWTATSLFFLFEAVLPALTFNMEMAKEGIRHLGYPDYFRVMLTVYKVLGGLALILPMVPRRIKEWAYAGFGFDLISATVSHGTVDGWGNGQSYFPLVVLGVLIISYVYYHKLTDPPTALTV
ncbi:MAG: DoxX family protein [Saprospiraceae bacterium]